MNVILIYCSQICKLFYPFRGFITYFYVVTLSCILFTRHEHKLSLGETERVCYSVKKNTRTFVFRIEPLVKADRQTTALNAILLFGQLCVPRTVRCSVVHLSLQPFQAQCLVYVPHDFLLIHSAFCLYKP
jgi:hypothetical protein